jgi:hypothetical protein
MSCSRIERLRFTSSFRASRGFVSGSGNSWMFHDKLPPELSAVSLFMAERPGQSEAGRAQLPIVVRSVACLKILENNRRVIPICRPPRAARAWTGRCAAQRGVAILQLLARFPQQACMMTSLPRRCGLRSHPSATPVALGGILPSTDMVSTELMSTRRRWNGSNVPIIAGQLKQAPARAARWIVAAGRGAPYARSDRGPIP